VREILIQALVFLPLLVLALSAHEAAHAWAALRLGDPTGRDHGRLSLLPFGHLDLIGSLLLPVAMLLMRSPFLVGYAKPTPVDPGRLRSPKADFSLVALAGPLGNLALALALAAVGTLLFRGLGIDNGPARALVGVGILTNTVLAMLNLLPLPGFDGLKALYAFLPDEWCWQLQRGERFFVMALLVAAALQVLGIVLWPGLWLGQALCDFSGAGLPLF
jgi:Zn-dependent protease